AGLSAYVVWKLEKQVPGRRAAGRECVGYAAGHPLDCGLELNDASSKSYRKPMTRLGLELHMVRTKQKLKDSDVGIEGRFEYLKRTRIRTDEGIFFQPQEKRSMSIISELGLKGAKAVKAPDMGPEEILEHSPPLVDKQISRHRSRVGRGLYLAQDRADIQRAVGMLAADLANPTAHFWKRPMRHGRYLVGANELGAFLPKVDAKIYKKGAIHPRTFSDSDHGGKKAKRKSTTCWVPCAEGVALATLVRRQGLIAVSSGESEFYALSTVSMDGKMARDLFTWFGVRVEWSLETDSSAARSISLKQGAGEVRHLDTRALWAQHATRLPGWKVPKCKGSENPVDIGAKSRAADAREQLCKQAGPRRLSGDFGAVREVEENAAIE
ncbi:unnamed protein product, partial [Prorocentrum cordatum]